MIEPGSIYHVFNQTNGGELLFREYRNYVFFLEKFQRFITPIAQTYAFCLMPNHFHFMIRIRDEEYIRHTLPLSYNYLFDRFISKQFSNFFSCYAQSYNKVYSRKGSLFRPNFKKKQIKKDDYFTALLLYIHNNPVKHKFTENAWEWPYSSLHSYIDAPDLSKSFKLLERSVMEEVLNWFGGQLNFLKAHQFTDSGSQEYILE